MEMPDVKVQDITGEPKECLERNNLETREVRFPINEIFGPTVAGEGPLVGAVTHFVRLNGCDYRCSWCDTLDAVLPNLIQSHNHPMSAGEIVDILLSRQPAGWVTLSGGNPAIFKDLKPLINAIQSVGFKVAMESQGSIAQPWFSSLDQIVFSPKPPSANMAYSPEKLEQCILAAWKGSFIDPPPIALKVVVFTDEDLDFACSVHQVWPDLLFYLQVGCPQGDQRPQTLEVLNSYYQALVSRTLGDARFKNARILPQLHKYLFGHGRGC